MPAVCTRADIPGRWADAPWLANLSMWQLAQVFASSRSWRDASKTHAAPDAQRCGPSVRCGFRGQSPDGFRGPFVGMPVTETPRITGWGHVRG